MTDLPPPPGNQPTTSPQDAKAHAKASRPWFKKKRFIVGGLLAVVLVAAVATSGGSDETTTRSAPNTNEAGGGDRQDSDVASDPDEDEEATSTEDVPAEPDEPADPAVARASDFVGGNVDPAFGPGEPGELSVIAVGTPDGDLSSIPFVVRNNTSSPVYSVAATGRVSDGGQLVGSGSDQGVEPAVVAPGEIAFGYVYFSATPPAGSTVEVSATADSDPGSFFNSVAMTISDANLVPGDWSDQLIGEVTAPADTEVSGPVSVMVLCVDAEGTLSRTFGGYTDGDASILPGTSATYSVGLHEDCPTFLIGSSGYDF